ncbi:allophanate hydrolase [Jatrophihabitans sp. DSM 45814]
MTLVEGDSKIGNKIGSTGVAAAGALAAAAAARALEQPAFITVLTDKQIEDFAGTASTDGALSGMAFAIKDNIDLAGVPTTAANPARSALAQASAPVVRRLIAAGAVPVAKTNLDQYATGLVGTRSPYGACHSVFSADHVSGGSSSGSAIAVASGIVSFALGTDTAGSGRVPAAFNELVGLKPTKGLLSATGVVPACRSLDCVTVLTRSVALARELFAVAAAFDPSDPYARPKPLAQGTLDRRPVIGIPAGDLGLDPAHEDAWRRACEHAGELFTLVAFDVQPFLDAAKLLYSGPWVAERAVAFGAELTDSSQIDPTVRGIVSGAAVISATDAFRGMYRLAELKRATDPTWAQVDAIFLPVTPGHPTLAEVAADPVGVNSRLGRFTNMTNLLDLAALAVPADRRADGLPFGVQFLGPAFSDELLLDLGSMWLGESTDDVHADAERDANDRVLIAVAGAHLTGQPLNADLVARGGRFVESTRTGPEYRMFEVRGAVRRPGLTQLPVAAGSTATDAASAMGIEVELWSLPSASVAGFIGTVAPPLAIGPMTLADGRGVLGFVCTADGVDPERDITAFGGWRAYLAQGPTADR